MIIHDMYCDMCGHVTIDVVGAVQEMRCNGCGCITPHSVICNGGTKFRYRFFDHPSDYKAYRGNTAISVDAHGQNDEGEEVRDVVSAHTGEEIAHMDMFRQESIQEKKEQIYFERDVGNGRRKTYNVGKKR